MSLTNEEKVIVLQNAATEFFMSLDTIPAWVSFINNVTKAQVKSFLKNAIDNAQSKCYTGSDSLEAKGDDYGDLSSQIDSL